MNNANNVNETLQYIFNLKNQGQNPQSIMQMLIQQNPQMQQSITILQNMSRGKSPQEFISQLARQNGVSEQNMQQIMRMFSK